VGAIVYPLLLLASWLLSRAWVIHDAVPQTRFFRFLSGPVAVVGTAFVMLFVMYELGLGITARRIAEGHTVVILLTTWLLLATANLVRDARIVSLEQQGRQGAVVLQRPVFGALKIVIVVTALVTWLDNIGYNITTLLASLGVGGIAVALALQKPLPALLPELWGQVGWLLTGLTYFFVYLSVVLCIARGLPVIAEFVRAQKSDILRRPGKRQ